MLLNPYRFDSAYPILYPDYGDNVLALGPYAFWQFDEPSGPSVLDSSGNGRNGAYIGTPLFGQNPVVGIGSSVDFQGSSNAEVGTAHAFGVTGWTWGFSFDARSLTGDIGLFHIGNYAVGGNQGLSARVRADGRIQIDFFSGSWRYTPTASSLVSINSRTSVTLRFDSSTQCSVFINGTFAQQLTFPVAVPAMPVQPLRIGAVYSSGYFNRVQGRVDEVFAFNSLLTNAEIAGLFS